MTPCRIPTPLAAAIITCALRVLGEAAPPVARPPVARELWDVTSDIDVLDENNPGTYRYPSCPHQGYST